MRFAAPFAVGTLCAWANLACSSTNTCTTELRAYSVAVSRDLPVAFSDVPMLSFQACVGSGDAASCQTVRAVAGSLGAAGDTIRGTVTQLAGGNAHVDAQVRVNEGPPSSTTPVSLVVANAAGTIVLNAAGDVRWDDGSCHTSPLNTSI